MRQLHLLSTSSTSNVELMEMKQSSTNSSWIFMFVRYGVVCPSVFKRLLPSQKGVKENFFSTAIVAVVAGSPIGDRCNQNRVIWRPLIYTAFWPLLKAYGLYCRPTAFIDGLRPLLMSMTFERREENFIRPLFLSLVAALLVPEIGRNILFIPPSATDRVTNRPLPDRDRIPDL